MSRLSIITDEISDDLGVALDACLRHQVTTVELRTIDGVSIVDLAPESLTDVRAKLTSGGFSVCNIASPFLKTFIDDKNVVVGNTHGAQSLPREQHWDVLKRSLEVADYLDAPMVRAFSFWRVENPTSVREDILETLGRAVEIVKDAGKILGLENEHACNIGSGTEAAWYLEQLPDPALGLIWDPGNIAALGVVPDRSQYEAVANRIVHVHVKDGNAIPATEFVPVGTGVCNWEQQLRWLHEGGYNGPLSLETHYKVEASDDQDGQANFSALQRLATRAGMPIQ